MEALTMTTDLQTLAAWLDAEYADLLAAQRDDYELQPGEFTAAMYAEAGNVKESTAHARLLRLRAAGRIPHKQVKIGGHNVWVYWKED